MQRIASWYWWCVDFLFPPTLRSERIASVQALPYRPRTTLYGSHVVISLMSYAHPDVRDAIQAAKFDASEPARNLLAQVLSDVLIEHALDTATEKHPVVVVPIPLSTARLRDRGYNQVEEVVRRTDALRNRFVTYNNTALMRTRDTPRQALATKEVRRANMKHAFTCVHPEELAEAHVVLVDDVVTTGATIKEAAKMLAPHVHSLTCVALARA